MKIVATLKLCEENMAGKIQIAGKATFIFTKAGAVTVDAGEFIICPDSEDPRTVYVEVEIINEDYFSHVLREEKRFDSMYKFFDLMVSSRATNLLNYIQTMGIIDSDCAYGVSTYDMVLPSAEDSCIDVQMHFTPDVTSTDIEDMDIVALYIRTDKPYDILLPLYPEEIRVTNPMVQPLVSCFARTHDEECERLNPDDYQTILDVIDDITKMNKTKTQILAIDSAACCGDEFDISEKCYPVDSLQLTFVRHGKSYNINMKGVHA